MPKAERQRDSLQKFLRYVLGVAPDEFGLWPDEAGFVPLKELVGALAGEKEFKGITANRIRELVGQALGQSPLEIEGTAIRVKPELAELPTPQPAPEKGPKLLHLGLKPSAWPHVLSHGLKPKFGRERVRLFSSEEQAKAVARRHSPEPVMVAVNRALAEKGGTSFWALTERIYLATDVAPAALFGPPVKPLPDEEKSTAAEPAGFFPGAVVHRGKIKGRRDDSPDWKNQARKERRKK
jgi:putative RNA 2'-phosphotransferase